MGLFRKKTSADSSINSFLVFDVETPNKKNDRICQIGMVLYLPTSKTPISQFGYFVNPETPFDEFCYSIHGISAADCLDKQTFAQLWANGLKNYFSTSVLIAHNALFDIGVLLKTLAAYQIDPPEIAYIDTLDLARRFYPSLPNHKLDTVASFLGHTITQHHDATHDALAAFHILDETVRRFGPNALSIQRYTQKFEAKPDYIQTMKDILTEIVSDGRVTFDEAVTFAIWMNENGLELPHQLCFDLNQTLFEILYDGKIDPDEEARILDIIDRIIHPASDTAAVCFQGKTFVLSGDFKHGTKSDVTAMIEQNGGTVANSVSKKVDFVVIGDYGSDQYGNGTYGSKVKRAMELQEQGATIEIITEDALYAAT